jgi:hypothetical protein
VRFRFQGLFRDLEREEDDGAAFVGHAHLLQKLPFAREHLDTVVDSIREVNDSVVRHLDRVRQAELRRAVGRRLRLRRRRVRRERRRRRVAERAPHSLELPGLRVEDDDALVAVTVSGVDLLRLRVDEDVGGLMGVFRIEIARALVRLRQNRSAAASSALVPCGSAADCVVLV